MKTTEDDAAVLWEKLQELHKKEREELALERERFENEKKTMDKLEKFNANNGDDIIEINAGGQIIQAHRSTLCIAPYSMFSQIFANRDDSNCGVARDDKGRIFLDYDPELIQSIINYLRLKKIEKKFDTTSPLSRSSPSSPLSSSSTSSLSSAEQPPLLVPPPKIPEGKKSEFYYLLIFFRLTSFFYPEGTDTHSGSIDISKIKIVQPGGSSIDVDRNNSILRLVYNGDGETTYFAACTPSLNPIPENYNRHNNCCSWKVTLNCLPLDAILFMGVIGNLHANTESYYDSEAYGWANDGVYVGGNWSEGEDDDLSLIDFALGETYYFHYTRCLNKKGKLTMLNMKTNATISMDNITTEETYIHFNFSNNNTKISLEPLSKSELRRVTQRSNDEDFSDRRAKFLSQGEIMNSPKGKAFLKKQQEQEQQHMQESFEDMNFSDEKSFEGSGGGTKQGRMMAQVKRIQDQRRIQEQRRIQNRRRNGINHQILAPFYDDDDDEEN
jgi:hypothetical protein